MRTYHAKIHGPVGNGKTILLAALHEAVLPTSAESGVDSEWFSPAIEEQAGRLRRGLLTERTTMESDGQELAHLVLPADQRRAASAGGDRLTIESYAGERWRLELQKLLQSGDATGLDLLAREFRVGEDNLLIVAVNPFLWHERLARPGYKELVYRLQQKYVPDAWPQDRGGLPTTSPLELAIEAAFFVLFGKAPGWLHDCHPLVHGRLEGLPADARLGYRAEAPDEESRFFIPPDQARQPWANGFLAALDRAAEMAVKDAAFQTRLAKSMAEYAEQVMVVLTHLDLLDEIKGLGREEHFRPIIQEMFGRRKSFRDSQSVLASNIRLDYCGRPRPSREALNLVAAAAGEVGTANPAPGVEAAPRALHHVAPGGNGAVDSGKDRIVRLMYVRDVLTGSAAEFLRKLLIEVSEIPPPRAEEESELDGRRWPDLVRESAHLGLQWYPTVLGAMLVAATLVAASAGDWWQGLWRWIVASVLLSAVAGVAASTIRRSQGRGAWVVELIDGTPRGVRLRDLTGRAEAGDVGALRLGSGWLGRILDVGRARLGGRPFPAPRLRRLEAVARGHLPDSSLDSLGDLFVILVVLASSALAVASLLV